MRDDYDPRLASMLAPPPERQSAEFQTRLRQRIRRRVLFRVLGVSLAALAIVLLVALALPVVAGYFDLAASAAGPGEQFLLMAFWLSFSVVSICISVLIREYLLTLLYKRR